MQSALKEQLRVCTERCSTLSHTHIYRTNTKDIFTYVLKLNVLHPQIGGSWLGLLASRTKNLISIVKRSLKSNCFQLLSIAFQLLSRAIPCNCFIVKTYGRLKEIPKASSISQRQFYSDYLFEGVGGG